jgi:hypothetical protein
MGNIIDKIDSNLFIKILIYIYSVIILLFIDYLFIELHNHNIMQLISFWFKELNILNLSYIVVAICVLTFIGITLKNISLFLETLVNFHKKIENRNKCIIYIKYVCKNFTSPSKIINWMIVADIYDKDKNEYSIYRQRMASKNGMNLSIIIFENESAKIISVGIFWDMLFLLLFHYGFWILILFPIWAMQIFQIRTTSKMRLIGIKGYSNKLI